MSSLSSELHGHDFHVVIFGSARIERNSPEYKKIYNLAKMIGAEGMDLVTGGGPGLMDAASNGHFAGRKNKNVHEIGLQIHLPNEQASSKHLDIKKEFSRFSGRLDAFMSLANCVVVAPGGVGTMLEFLYTWQLMQVHQTCKLPIILLGDMWPGLIRWIKREPLHNEFLSQEDMDLLYLAHDVEDAMHIIRQAHKDFLATGKNTCTNATRYKLRR